ncbi:SusC/RagA family TonB-linked outer membrane protein [Xanthocytophaga agilis]|uniref:SusC/RagA family TonB-linked outer membrane protein n=1 Tax=Xanthocytophaga agilis TaxID=3048010 RepID=A0AAE3R5A2_9BACT|nr:SusC/RagA family TonB-linked outer membrane protein [Xanthocytophaga agilis]MDJ1503480.1 SusC/RagA family TonB-linked outer membrane protein [Xanthocytophaga agilis]
MSTIITLQKLGNLPDAGYKSTSFRFSPLRFLWFLILLVSTTAYAQKTVKGKVSDAADGSSLPGVSVSVKGTTTGTTTDAGGNYTLNVPSDNTTLVFSFVGYVSQEIALGGRSSVNISLAADVQALQEVVVIGYGEQQKKDVTGGVVAVTSKDFNQGVIASPEQLLQGRAAGIQMTPASGEPGAGVNIRIRGTTSVRSGNNPLYVIDGVPVSGDATTDGGADYGSGGGTSKNPLNFLNPSDIESITVLKDASAAAIYGARGANGVVLITTKKGKNGQSMLNFSASGSVSGTLKRYDLLSASEFPDALTRSGNTINNINVRNGNTDWQKEIFRSSFSQNYNLNYGGGNETTTYYMSLGYSDQQGIIKNTAMTRLTGRVNASHKMLNDKLRVDLQLTTSGIKDQYAPIGNNAGYQGSLLGAALQANPTYPIYDEQGRYFTPGNYDVAGHPQGDFRNPVAMLNMIHDNSNTNRTLGNISATYRLIKGLSYKINFGIDNSSSERAQKVDPYLTGYNSNQVNNINVFTGFNNIQNRTTTSRLVEHTLSYNEKVGIGQLDAVAGFSYQKFENKGHYIQSGYFLDSTGTIDNIGYVNNKDYKAFFAGEDKNVFELQSYFGRVNYNIKDKYMLTATVRIDGSSKFGSNNKYGTFPSLGAAWRLSNESFIPQGIFDDLKLRGSWGITGNQEFPANLTKATRNVNPNNATSDADNAANDNLKWEQTRQWAVGLDFAFLSGRLTGSVDYFNKNTKDLLFRDLNDNPVSPSPYIWRNLDANVSNKGFEFSVNYKAVDKGVFRWEIAYNLTHVVNKVEKLGGSFRPTGEINGQGLSGAYAQRIQQGYPLFAFFVPKFSGFDENGFAVYPNGDQPVYSGSPQPKFTHGLTNNFSYGNWNLSIFINSSTGFYIYNNTANALFYKAALNLAHNVTKDVANNSEYRFNAGSVSSRFLEKGDFIRLSNVNLGYTFKLPEASQVKTLRLSVTGQNLFLLTKYTGVDPEVNTNKALNQIPSLGIDYTSYPSARVITFGLNASF